MVALCLIDPASNPSPLTCRVGNLSVFPKHDKRWKLLQKEHELQLQRRTGSYRIRSPSTAPNGRSTPASEEPESDPTFLKVPFTTRDILRPRDTLSDEENLPTGSGAGIGHPGTTTRCPTRRGPAGGAAPARGAAGTALLSSRLHFIPAHSPFATRPREPPVKPGRRGGSFRRRGAEERCSWGGIARRAPGGRGEPWGLSVPCPPRTGQRLHLAAFGARTEGSPGPQPPGPSPEAGAPRARL